MDNADQFGGADHVNYGGHGGRVVPVDIADRVGEV